MRTDVTDGNGFRLYHIMYKHNGESYALEVYATSIGDAYERVNKALNSPVINRVEEVVPASVPGAGLIARLLCWWKNLRGV